MEQLQVVAKMRCCLRMFWEYTFSAELHFYNKTLQQTTHLAYTMQKSDILISDIKDALSDAIEKLRDHKEEETELLLESQRTESGEVL